LLRATTFAAGPLWPFTTLSLWTFAALSLLTLPRWAFAALSLRSFSLSLLTSLALLSALSVLLPALAALSAFTALLIVPAARFASGGCRARGASASYSSERRRCGTRRCRSRRCRLRRRRLSISESLLHCRFLIGQLLGIVGINNPSRQRIGNRLGCRARRLFNRHGHRFDARSLRIKDIEAIDIIAGIVVLSVIDLIEQFHARRDPVHLRLGVQLSHRQVAGLGRVASADANELSNRR
jgi:hypothetical protein